MLLPIKHVSTSLKENRTYDQVLGDMPEGNGDKQLVLFGENVTNQHALARGLCCWIYFYVNGEVSADGANWTMELPMPPTFLKNMATTSYGGRGGTLFC